MLLIVLLQASTDVSGLISLYREVGAMLVGIGFICAGLSVLKKLITNHEKNKGSYYYLCSSVGCLAINMVVDMSIADVIILIVISLGIYHFLTKRKVPKDGRNNEKKQVPGVEKDKRENIQEKAPVIRVIFQVENTEEDDLAKEIADMFLDRRTYYYSGKKPEETKEKTEDTEMEKFVRFEDVQWNLIKTIQV